MIEKKSKKENYSDYPEKYYTVEQMRLIYPNQLNLFDFIKDVKIINGEK